MNPTTQRILRLGLISGLFALLGTSCNTTRGFGRDVQKTGRHIERAAS